MLAQTDLCDGSAGRRPSCAREMTDAESKGRPGGSRGGLHTSAQSQTRESHPAKTDPDKTDPDKNDLAENNPALKDPAEKEEQMQRGLVKRDIESELG